MSEFANPAKEKSLVLAMQAHQADLDIDSLLADAAKFEAFLLSKPTPSA